ncbi:MAG: hypothetical protein JNK05_21730 [Myxococcales bacterium]|nr:hypothetical protein [Myxococcales bacterium]
MQFLQRESRSRALASLAAASVLSLSSVAIAQTPDLTTRRLLIEQGQTASQAGDHALALQRAEQAMAIQVTPSLRLFYARELVANRRPADAFSQAESCVQEVERDASVPNRDALLGACRAIEQQTRSEVGTLTVSVTGERPENLRITLSGRPMATALLGVPSAVNPGTVVVVAMADGYRTVRREVEVARGAQAQVELPMEIDPHAVIGRGAGGAGGDPAQPQYRTRPISIGAVVVTASGAAILASSGLFFALRQGQISPCAIEPTTGFTCETAAERDALRARSGSITTMNALTNAALIGGSIVLAGGVAWLVADRVTSREQVPTAQQQSRRRRAPVIVATTDGRGAQLTVGGSW